MPSEALADCTPEDRRKRGGAPCRVFGFGGGTADDLPPGIDPVDLLGGKGAGLAEMSRLGLPVPPGFTLSTPVCQEFRQDGGRHPDWLEDQVSHALVRVEALTDGRFGSAAAPLLVAVRSGAAVSMPGMMDTVLNLGLNDVTVMGLAAWSGDSRFAWDTYRRFIQMYGAVVMGIDHDCFEQILDAVKQRRRCRLDSELKAEDCRTLVREYQEMIVRETRTAFPAGCPRAALAGDRRRVPVVEQPARRLLPAPSRHPRTGRDGGDGAGDGVRQPGGGQRNRRRLHPRSLDRRERAVRRVPARCAGRRSGRRHPDAAADKQRWQHVMPAVHAELEATWRGGWKRICRDMQDLEFTVQQGRLYLLQTRSGKRTIQAAVKIAVHLAEEGMITPEEAVAMVDMEALDHMLQPVLDPDAPRTLLALGLAASPGAVTGKLAFTVADAQERAALGESRHPVPDRNRPGGHPRHPRRARHPDGAGRHDQPRRRGGSRHGQDLRRRRRGTGHRRRSQVRRHRRRAGRGRTMS